MAHRAANSTAAVRRDWPGLTFTVENADITRAAEWCIRGGEHIVIVHLGGAMQELETELDGHGGSFGPALPGEIWTAPAGRRYASRARGGQIRFAVLRLAPDAPARLCGRESTALELAPRAAVRDEFLHAVVRRMAALSPARDDLAEMLGESLAHSAVLHLCQAHDARGLVPHAPGRRLPPLSPDTIRRLRTFMRDRLATALSLTALAREARLSVHQFLIAFHRAFGSSPAQYLLAQRVRAAQHLLAGTRKDITTIALECGFSSHSHFTRVFGKHAACTPLVWRRNFTSPAPPARRGFPG